MSSPLRTQRPPERKQDPFILLLLGLQRQGAILDARLRDALAAETTDRPVDGPFLEALLGIISLRRTVGCITEGPRGEDPTSPTESTDWGRRWLR